MQASWADGIIRRLGGPRVVALPLLRILAVAVGAVWVALAPRDTPGLTTVVALVVAFGLYSAVTITALWLRPARVLRLNLLVLLIDVGFALALIAATGGAGSAMFVALLVIAALQSYYYGARRGILVAAVSAVLYLVVVWPTVTPGERSNVVVRIAALLGAAIGIGLLATLEDRERVKVLDLTREAQVRERFIGNVVESLQEGVVALDAEGRVVTWNEAIARTLGVAETEVLGREFLACFADLAPEVVRSLLAGHVERAGLDHLEYRTPGGASAVLNVKGTALREGGRPAGAVLLVEDITDRVALERSARQAEKLAGIGTLAAGIAHELNNPIGIISSRTELMLLDAEARPLPDDLREDLRVLHRHAQRVARIAQGLLSFARQAPHERRPIDLNQVVDETLVLMEKSIARDGVRLTCRLAPELPSVQGDASALQQVLMNLLTNARDALGGEGEVAIVTDATTDPRGVRLTVRDTGPGIPPDVLPRIFDPFFTTKPEGTGLGLAVSYGIVRDHQGTVDVQSAPGRGTTFTLTFPAATTP
ncbi:MAG TPA: ATP-binding protein, partial [Candidatus Tectomicrobia bacterium]|nr:ATP-binding protein [Candidatus Tectomicrobia bacterium]